MALKKHGKDGSVKFKGFAGTSSSAGGVSDLCVKKWEATLKFKTDDTSSTCNPDWEESQNGKKVVEFTLEAQLEVSPFGSAIDTDQGYASVQLINDGVTLFDIPRATLSEVKITNVESDVVTYSITGKSSGTVTLG